MCGTAESALPDYDCLPSHSPKFTSYAPISPPVRRLLLCPVVMVSNRKTCCEAACVAVPEAPMDEDRY